MLTAPAAWWRHLRQEAGNERLLKRRRHDAEAALSAELDRLAGHDAIRRRLAAGRRDLVMGLAIGYGASDLAPFLRSLRAGGFSGGITLFVSAPDEETLRLFSETAATAVPFLAVRSMPMSMNSARMVRYLHHLVEAALTDDRVPGRVMLCDVRDVVFQSDPFADMGRSRLRFHLETGPVLGACPVNSDWMLRGFGRSALEEVRHRPIACAGTLIGTAEAVFDYLIAMLRLLSQVPLIHRWSGVDQAAHNLILWRRLVDGAEAVPNGGDVLTVPRWGLASLAQLDADGRIRNKDGTVSAVVHQYDRDPAAKAAIAARWRG